MTVTSCILIISLIVVSLANLVLLAHIIMQALKKGDNINEGNADIEPIRRADPFSIMAQKYQAPVSRYKFMAAIIFIDNGDVELICGGAIISKYWVLSAGHCGEVLMKKPMKKLRVSTNSPQYQQGTWYDLDRIVVHDHFDPLNRINDVALISVRRPFRQKSPPMSLPLPHFQYIANTSALSLGWLQNEKLYAVELRLFWHKFCELYYPEGDVFQNGFFCAGKYKGEDRVCTIDPGGVLVQRNILIGLVSRGLGCNGVKPTVFTKMALYQNWIEYVERRHSINIGAIFKN